MVIVREDTLNSTWSPALMPARRRTLAGTIKSVLLLTLILMGKNEKLNNKSYPRRQNSRIHAGLSTFGRFAVLPLCTAPQSLARRSSVFGVELFANANSPDHRP